ncbi:transposase domain-containing protein, partial [Acidocella sp.]
DPETYLANVIDRMAKGHPANRLAELLPWNWGNTTEYHANAVTG